MTAIEIRIRDMFDSLTHAEQKAAAFFLEDANRVFRMSIAQLAEESGVSQVAWVRLGKTLGFSGLKDLKRELFEQMSRGETLPAEESSYEAITGDGSAANMAEAVCVGAVQAVLETHRLLDEEKLKAVVECIISANTIKLFGLGASALVAEDLFNKLIRLGFNAVFCRDSRLQHAYAENLTEHDAAVFFSHGGSTREVLETLRLARKRGAKTVSVTKYGRSDLAVESDYSLFTACPEIYRRSGALSSRIAQLLLVDMLYAVIADKEKRDCARADDEDSGAIQDLG